MKNLRSTPLYPVLALRPFLFLPALAFGFRPLPTREDREYDTFIRVLHDTSNDGLLCANGMGQLMGPVQRFENYREQKQSINPQNQKQ